MVAASHRGIRVLELLSEFEGLESGLKDQSGRTVAHYAVSSAQRSVMELLTNSFEIDFNQAFAIVALYFNDFHIICRDNDGITPAHLAAAWGIEEVARYLAEEFSVNRVDKFGLYRVSNCLCHNFLSRIIFRPHRAALCMPFWAQHMHICPPRRGCCVEV